MSVAVLAGCAPRNAAGLDWLNGMGKANLEEFRALEEGDAALERFLEKGVAELGAVQGSKDFTEALEGLVCEADRRCLTGAFLEYQLQGCRDIASGEIWGWFDDDKAIWRDWGIDVADVSVPVTIWHGIEDRVIPVAHAEWLAANLPTAQSRMLSGEGHFSLIVSHYDAVLDELVASG
jgi:pimeloyl-ACP methyl ester carboxylesterase